MNNEAEFRTTHLCIKQHSVTGLKYFCKTTGSHGRVISYRGSGRYWKRHLKKHGSKVETIWYCLFTEKDELVKFALMCSDQWDIVNAKDSLTGKKIWANEKPENGLDGATPGSRHSDITRAKISEARQGQPAHNKGKPGVVAWNKGVTGIIKDSEETKIKKSISHLGDKNPMFGKIGEKNPRFRIARLKIECPYCHKLIAQGNYSRWHGENCKLKN